MAPRPPAASGRCKAEPIVFAFGRRPGPPVAMFERGVTRRTPRTRSGPSGTGTLARDERGGGAASARTPGSVCVRSIVAIDRAPDSRSPAFSPCGAIGSLRHFDCHACADRLLEEGRDADDTLGVGGRRRCSDDFRDFLMIESVFTRSLEAHRARRRRTGPRRA